PATGPRPARRIAAAGCQVLQLLGVPGPGGRPALAGRRRGPAGGARARAGVGPVVADPGPGGGLAAGRIPALSPGGPHGPPRPWPLSACEGGRSGGTRPTMPLPPSPAHGGGPGWGQPDDESSKRACGAAPIPTFPRKRGKGPELADRGAPSPPAREGWSGDTRPATPLAP